MKAALLLLSFALAQDPGVLLRRKLVSESVDVYKMTDRVEQTVVSAMGTMPMTITSDRTYVLRTTKVDEGAGNALFEATTTVDKITADGAASAMGAQKPGPVVQKGKIDVRGRMTLDPTPSSETVAGLMSGTQGAVAAGNFVEFPEKMVKVGDRWEVVVPKNPLLFDRDQHLSETLTGEKVVDGTPVWTVSINGTIQTSIDGSSLKGSPENRLDVRIEGQDEILGEGLVEKATGRTVLMTLRSNAKRTIKLLDTGLTLQVQGKSESKVTLEKPKP